MDTHPAPYKDTHTSLLADFLAFINEQQLLKKGGTTLLAVSGGLDSVVMSHLFHHANLRFAIAHCNFNLRETASLQDQQFVLQLAKSYKVACYTQTFDTLAYAKQHGLSIQMAARKLRYQWFEVLCNKQQLDQIATAHHSQDSLETLLLNLTKGTGIAGLHGILPRKGRLIRPLLFADKSRLLHYAQCKQLAWREDASNADDTYARNLLRNQVMPLLRLINPNLEATSKLTIERLHQVEMLFQEQLAGIQPKVINKKKPVYEVLPASIQDKPWAPVVIWELLKPFGFNFPQIKGLLSHKPQSGKKIAAPQYQLYVDRQQWLIMPHIQPTKDSYLIPDNTLKTLVTKAYTLKTTIIARTAYRLVLDKQVAALDLACLAFPLHIRKWQQGDFFYPLGMQQRKKLSDFLVDLKVPIPYKAHIDVLVSGNKIAWVIGYRLDDRFKLTAATQQVYEICLLPIPRPILS